ncbi:MAG TPA: hypothetical protein VJ903_03675 [Clostridia bacterium]|nr:hypothetical protein [Clostridia bacterium]
MKILKGSAFFSSLIIIVLLVVGLSTATFAWFSANNVVNVSSISFIAQTRDKGAAASDLLIAWEPNPTEDNYLIEFAQPIDIDKQLSPIMPLEAPMLGATRSKNELGENIFAQSFTSGVQENGVYMYDGFLYELDNDDVAPYQCVGKEADQYDFYLINKNLNFGQEVTIDYSITGDLQDKLCIAIFVEDILQFVLSNTAQIYYGDIERHTLVADTLHVDNLVKLSKDNKAYIPVNGSVKVTMYAWYNGVTMRDNDINKQSTLNMLQFKAQPATR